MRWLIFDILKVHAILGVSVLVFALPSSAQISEIIDTTGDGIGNTLIDPQGVAVDSSGNVYVTGLASDNAFKITPGGAVTEIIDSTGDGNGNTLIDPRGVAVDSSGNVYVASHRGRLFRITPGGTVTLLVHAETHGLGRLDGVAVDSSGNVYATGDGGVFRIAASGTCSITGTLCTITIIMDSTGDRIGNTLYQSSGVVVDSSGNVYVTGVGTDNAFKIATPGTCSTTGTRCAITEIIDSTGDGSGNTLEAPFGIAVDSGGNVYVAGDFSDNVFKITPGGTITEIIDWSGDGAGNTLSFAADVAVDSSANVYVTGVATDNAFKIATPGTCSTTGTPCMITEIIDSTGDGGGNTLDGSVAIAVDSGGDLYLTGYLSRNAFKIILVGCGNAIVESGEQCDDGNAQSGDCCSASCQFEAPGSSCDDSDVCTAPDTCDGAGVCDSGALVPDCGAPLPSGSLDSRLVLGLLLLAVAGAFLGQRTRMGA